MITSDAQAGWIARHRGRGHNPYPAPTKENPDRWECECEPGGWTAVWRIHTPAQIHQKFAHLRKS